jgi:hypothetical protein
MRPSGDLASAPARRAGPPRATKAADGVTFTDCWRPESDVETVRNQNVARRTIHVGAGGVGSITDARYGDRFTQLRKEIFGDNFPASALITVAGLARPEMLVEVQGIAVLG